MWDRLVSIVFLSSSPAGTPTALRRRSKVLTALATTAAAGLLGAAVIAPATLSGTAAIAAPVPGDQIFQQFVASEIPDTSIPAESFEIERLPDPEPVPTPEPTAAAQPVVASTPLYTGGGAPAEWMAAAGIAESDWGYVDYIAGKESGWNPNATNSSSGACGVIQALPCSKVPGNGYDPVDNLRWANGYATGRYGSWAQAYAFWTSNHWW